MMGGLRRLPQRVLGRLKREIFGAQPSLPPARVIVAEPAQDTSAPAIAHLAIAVTFHFAEHRLDCLRRIAEQFLSLGDRVSVHVLTNATDERQHAQIVDAVNAKREVPLQIEVPVLLGHPLLLTWAHFAVFRRLLATDETITHFMYVEDDILIQPNNISYWLKGRQVLRPFGMYPSFVRYEIKDGESTKLSSDASIRASLTDRPRVLSGADYVYVSLPHQYQGMYLLDRELMEEHLNGPSSDPNFGPWRICEKAAQGLTFASAPEGFTARNLVGYHLPGAVIDEDSLIHHLPNNYANNPNTIFAKIPVDELICVNGPSKMRSPGANGRG